MPDEISMLTPVHEAAHVVLAVVSKFFTLTSRIIRIQDEDNGRVRMDVAHHKLTKQGYDPDNRAAIDEMPEVIEDAILIILGGKAAELKLCTVQPQLKPKPHLWVSDNDQVSEAMERAQFSDDRLPEFEQRVARLVEQHWDLIFDLGQKLCDLKNMGKEMRTQDALKFVRGRLMP